MSKEPANANLHTEPEFLDALFSAFVPEDDDPAKLLRVQFGLEDVLRALEHCCAAGVSGRQFCGEWYEPFREWIDMQEEEAPDNGIWAEWEVWSELGDFLDRWTEQEAPAEQLPEVIEYLRLFFG